jgi:hypothetical protein
MAQRAQNLKRIEMLNEQYETWKKDQFLVLEPVDQPKRHWLGIKVRKSFALGLQMPQIDPADILEIPEPHITLIHGINPADYDAIREIVVAAKITMPDLEFGMPYLVSPPRTPDDFWCVDVKSPKLEELQKALKKEFLETIPDRHVPLHVTLCCVKREQKLVED